MAISNNKKACKRCNIIFTPSKLDKRINFCSDKCRCKHRNENDYMKKYYKLNKNKWVKRQGCEGYKEERNKLRRERYANDKEYRDQIKKKVVAFNFKNPTIKKGQHLREKYGLSLDGYNKILKSQRGECAICGSRETNSKQAKYLYVDHDHKTGKTRGLLCHNCNFALGYFKDNVDSLTSAIKYLKKHNKEVINGYKKV